MRVKAEKLLFEPSLFRDEPSLLQEILKLDITKEKDVHPDFKKMYTYCSCKDVKFYWQEVEVNGYSVEVFLCGACENWSMSVTY